MNRLTFAGGFIYGCCVVIFGWLIHKLFGMLWWQASALVIVLDIIIRLVLTVIAKRYLKQYKE